MTHTPKVSIVTRTKNRNILLGRALKSVDDQSFDDYEHIILNDGGDIDEVETLLKQYPNKRRRIIHNKKSVGLVPALNQAIRASSGTYIAILDDDDVFDKDRILLSVEVLGKGAVATVSPMDVVIEKIEDGKVVELSRHQHPESGVEVSLYHQCHRNYLTNSVITYTREIYDLLGGYDESLETAEDWDFGIRLMREVDVVRIASEKPLVFYHQRPSDMTQTGNSVHAGVREQERTINIIRNKYLRNDLKAGALGVGYIMNNVENGVENIVRIEGHINRSVPIIASEVKNEIDSLFLLSKIKKRMNLK